MIILQSFSLNGIKSALPFDDIISNIELLIEEKRDNVSLEKLENMQILIIR